MARTWKTPENSHAEPGAWLLISTWLRTVAAQLTDALKVRDACNNDVLAAACADHAAQGRAAGCDQLRYRRVQSWLQADRCRRPAPTGPPCVAAELSNMWCVRPRDEITAQEPRLGKATHTASGGVAPDRPNLSRWDAGLLRVIGASTAFEGRYKNDVDEQTGAGVGSASAAGGRGEDETAWRNDQWYTASVVPSLSCAPSERQNHRRRPRCRHAPTDPYPA